MQDGKLSEGIESSDKVGKEQRFGNRADSVVLFLIINFTSRYIGNDY